MLKRRGHTSTEKEDAEMKEIFEEHLLEVKSLIGARSNVNFIYVNYNKLVTKPRSEIEKVFNFFSGKLDKNKLLEVIDINQYRNRISE